MSAYYDNILTLVTIGLLYLAYRASIYIYICIIDYIQLCHTRKKIKIVGKIALIYGVMVGIAGLSYLVTDKYKYYKFKFSNMFNKLICNCDTMATNFMNKNKQSPLCPMKCMKEGKCDMTGYARKMKCMKEGKCDMTGYARKMKCMKEGKFGKCDMTGYARRINGRNCCRPRCFRVNCKRPRCFGMQYNTDRRPKNIINYISKFIPKKHKEDNKKPEKKENVRSLEDEIKNIDVNEILSNVLKTVHQEKPEEKPEKKENENPWEDGIRNIDVNEILSNVLKTVRQNKPEEKSEKKEKKENEKSLEDGIKNSDPSLSAKEMLSSKRDKSLFIGDIDEINEILSNVIKPVHQNKPEEKLEEKKMKRK